MERTVRRFEPRLSRVQVTEVEGGDLTFSFRISGMLRVDVGVEPVVYDADLPTAVAPVPGEARTMSDELYQYYEQELTFFRQMAGEFAQKYPKVAGRLQLDETRESTDPHVERLIEAFALLAAACPAQDRRRVSGSRRIVCCTCFIRTICGRCRRWRWRSSGSTRNRRRVTEPSAIPAGTTLTSRASGGLECSFRTAYPVTLWPIKVTGASLVSVAAAQATGVPQEASFVLRIQLEMFGNLPSAALKAPYLRFFLNGDGTPIHLLYELLFAHALRVQLRPRGPGRNIDPIVLSADSIRPVGFERNEGLLNYSDRSFLGYRLLQEYFHFPQKFIFFDLAGLDSVPLDTLGTSFESADFLPRFRIAGPDSLYRPDCDCGYSCSLAARPS